MVVSCRLFVGVLCSTLVCYSLLCVHSSFEIVLKRNEKLVALLLLSYRCSVTINVLWYFLTVPWVCLQLVVEVFPDHTHLLFENICRSRSRGGGSSKTYGKSQVLQDSIGISIRTFSPWKILDPSLPDCFHSISIIKYTLQQKISGSKNV